MLDDAAARGWKILTFGMGRGGIAGLEEMIRAHPQIQGVIVDGPGSDACESNGSAVTTPVVTSLRA